jgi:hypothetical protein
LGAIGAANVIPTQAAVRGVTPHSRQRYVERRSTSAMGRRSSATPPAAVSRGGVRAGGLAILAASVLTSLAGCGANGKTRPRHIVMFDSEGNAVDPTADPATFQEYPELAPDAYVKWLDRIIEGIEGFDAKTHDCARVDVERPGAARTRQQQTVEQKSEDVHSGRSPVVRVLIYIHGGLNSPDTTIQRATHLHDRIVDAGYYPIFVNWNSSLLSSYGSHLWSVRQGAERKWAWVTSPLWFAGDLTRAVFRLPVVWWWRIQDSFDLADDRERADAVFDAVVNGPDPQGLQIRRAPGDGDEDGSFLWGTWELITLPVRAAATLVVDTGGTGSWNAMQRRVELLFDQDEFVHDASRGTIEPGEPTPLMRFMERLHRLQSEMADQGRTLEVTLIGHSMGSMIANRLLQRGVTFGDSIDANRADVDQKEKARTHRNYTVPVFHDVVFMAAACSIHQYEASAFPYLEQHQDTNFFHVMLDPDSETRETYLAALSPKGSLLVWIDDFFSNPFTLGDRTAGRYVNLLPALHHTPLALRPRVFVKLFDDGEPSYPQKHGEFGGQDFWSKEFWWE